MRLRRLPSVLWSADAAGDPQLQSSAAWATGIIEATMGEAEAGIAACQRAFDLAPDPVPTALALGWLGYVHLEAGDAAQAIPRLEQSIQLLGQFQFPQPQGWFTVILAEAHRLEGRGELANRGLRIATAAHSLHGVGWAQRALGRIARARGAVGNAEVHLLEALRVFTTMEARYEVARVHLDLAPLAHAQGERERQAGHIHQARRLFTELGVPRYVERTEALAAKLAAAP